MTRLAARKSRNAQCSWPPWSVPLLSPVASRIRAAGALLARPTTEERPALPRAADRAGPRPPAEAPIRVVAAARVRAGEAAEDPAEQMAAAVSAMRAQAATEGAEAAAATAGAGPRPTIPGLATTRRPSWRARISCSSRPIPGPTQFMPVGNGTLGAAVWAAGGFTAPAQQVRHVSRPQVTRVADDSWPRAHHERLRLPWNARSLRRRPGGVGGRDDRPDLRASRQGRSRRRRDRGGPQLDADGDRRSLDLAARHKRRRQARLRRSRRRSTTPRLWAIPDSALARSQRSPPTDET
jgi:hypothetical protein